MANSGIFLAIGVLIVIFVLLIIIKGVRQVRQAEVFIIERLGKYKKTLQGGLNFVIPFLDKERTILWKFPVTDSKTGRVVYVTRETPKIDIRENVLDFPKQNVITKDNVGIEIDALLYFQITDPVKATYEIANLPDAIERLTQTTLRNVIGELELDQTLTSRDDINNKLRMILDEATDKWGVKVNRVELKDITPPADVRESMEKQMKAERSKRALILDAEGKKKADILKAEGEQEARIKRAEGEKQSEILRAEGASASRRMIAQAEAEAIRKILTTTESQGIDMAKYETTIRYLVALKYMESLKDVTSGNNTKTVFMPYEASGVLGSLGSLKELFGESGTDNKPKAN